MKTKTQKTSKKLPKGKQAPGSGNLSPKTKNLPKNTKVSNKRNDSKLSNSAAFKKSPEPKKSGPKKKK